MEQRAWRAAAVRSTAVGVIVVVTTIGATLAQGTGNIWITQINGQPDVIQGYRHSVTITGDEMALVGTFTRSAKTVGRTVPHSAAGLR